MLQIWINKILEGVLFSNTENYLLNKNSKTHDEEDKFIELRKSSNYEINYEQNPTQNVNNNYQKWISTDNDQTKNIEVPQLKRIHNNLFFNNLDCDQMVKLKSDSHNKAYALRGMLKDTQISENLPDQDQIRIYQGTRDYKCLDIEPSKNLFKKKKKKIR